MKKKIVSLILAINAVMVFSAASVFATATVETGTAKYDYATNKISSTDETTLENQELTMIVVKGDKTAANATFTNSEVVAVEQTEGTSYNAVMQDLGVKLEADDKPLEQGTYTIITSGESAAVQKDLLILGDADGIKDPDDDTKTILGSKTLGTVRDITIANDGSRWSYACVCTVIPSSGGVIMQRYNSSKSKWQYIVKPLDYFYKTDFTTINTKVDIGFQVNEFSENPENVQFSVIPFND